MVRVCAFPSCGNRMSRNTPLSFHRLPLSHTEMLKLWLVALQMDITTPVHTLRLADHRVCSDHFDRDDYCQPKRTRKAIPKHFFLKKTAVPRLRRPAAGRKPQEAWAAMDRPPTQVKSTGNKVNVPAATTEKRTLQHIVDEEAILQLMKNCPVCDRKCRCSKHTRSPYLIVYQSCYFCNYQRKWASQPEARNMNIKAHKLSRKKHKPKDTVSVNAKAKSCQRNKTGISEFSVS